MGKVKRSLPLLKILKDLPDDHRKIVIDHLDEKACESVADCIIRVLRSGKKLKDNKSLKEFILQNEGQIKDIVTQRGGSFAKKRRSLARFGGGPLGFVMQFAIPLIIDHIVRQVEQDKRRRLSSTVMSDVVNPSKPPPLL